MTYWSQCKTTFEPRHYLSPSSTLKQGSNNGVLFLLPGLYSTQTLYEISSERVEYSPFPSGCILSKKKPRGIVVDVA